MFLITVKRKRRKTPALLNQAWMMKILLFRMTQTISTTSHRVRGALMSNASFDPVQNVFRKKKKQFAIYCFAFSSVEEEEVLSSEEDVPFRDDLNDQSYDPKVERFVVLYERDWVVHM